MIERRQPVRAAFEVHQPERNYHRANEVEVCQDLLFEWVVTVRYGRAGRQVRVPITGNRSKRVPHRAMNISSGDVEVLIPHEGVQETHQTFLGMIRSHWRG